MTWAAVCLWQHRAMRWLALVGVLLVVGAIGWPLLALRSMPKKIEAAAERAGSRFSVTNASTFADVLGVELAALGLTIDPDGLVVTMSAAEAIGEGANAGIERSISAQVAAHRPTLFGAFSVPVRTTVQVRGVVNGGVFHPSSQWPAESRRLPLLPSTSGREAVVGELPATDSEFVWSTPSADATVRVVSVETKGGCELRCEQADAGVRWSSVSACKVKRTHLRFVSSDCERMLAIDSSTILSKFWETAVVGTVMHHADVAYEINAVTVIGDIEKVRAAHGWLKGLFDVSGIPPAYGPDGGTVDFVTVDGRAHSIPLTVAKETGR